MDINILKTFYSDEGHERVGIILRDGSILELQNVAPDPEESFSVSTEDLIKFEGFSVATWHTHPNAEAQLSGRDYEGFRAWPDLLHFIVGKDGIRCYSYDMTRRAIIETDPNNFTRLLEEALSA